MGCGDVCPYVAGTRYLDWTLPDPVGLGLGAVRPICDEIKRRGEALIADIDHMSKRAEP